MIVVCEACSLRADDGRGPCSKHAPTPAIYDAGASEAAARAWQPLARLEAACVKLRDATEVLKAAQFEYQQALAVLSSHLAPPKG